MWGEKGKGGLSMELFSFTCHCLVDSGQTIRVGDRVRVKASVKTPRYKWGSITHRSVGTVTSISPNGKDVAGTRLKF